MPDIPCDKTIDRICRKDRPPFRAREWPRLVRCNPNRCPSVLSITCTLVGGRFINENQLVCTPTRQAIDPQPSELWTLLCRSYLHLQVRNSVINDRKGYLLFRPLDTPQHTFDALLIYPDIECIPNEVNLIVNVGGRTCRKVVEESLNVRNS